MPRPPLLARVAGLARVAAALARVPPLADAAWAVRVRFNNRFRRRLVVLTCDSGTCDRPAGAPAGRAAAAVTVRPHGPGEDRPAGLLDALAARFGADFPAVDAAERAGGGTLWVGALAGEPVAFVRTKPGDRVAGWHEPLRPDDRLVYAMATCRRARGRGAGTAVLRAALAAVPPAGAAWADTMTWNAPALAALRNAGFRALYEADPLPDHPD